MNTTKRKLEVFTHLNRSTEQFALELRLDGKLLCGRTIGSTTELAEALFCFGEACMTAGLPANIWGPLLDKAKTGVLTRMADLRHEKAALIRDMLSTSPNPKDSFSNFLKSISAAGSPAPKQDSFSEWLKSLDVDRPIPAGDAGFPCDVIHRDEPIKRKLESHKVNGCNENITITVLDQPGDGGANHLYLIEGVSPAKNKSWKGRDFRSTAILFQNGPIPQNGTNGLTQEVLLAILIDRLEGFQNGQFACIENQVALNHLRSAQETLKLRTKLRVARGVEGTHKL